MTYRIVGIVVRTPMRLQSLLFFILLRWLYNYSFIAVNYFCINLPLEFKILPSKGIFLFQKRFVRLKFKNGLSEKFHNFFNAHLPFPQRKAMSLDLMRFNDDLQKNR